MNYLIESNELVNKLKSENINTWFDLGLFVDRFRDETKEKQISFPNSFDEYKKKLKNCGIGFITFYYSVDGVTIEVEKYAKVFRLLFDMPPIHYLAGAFYPQSKPLIDKTTKLFTIPEANGFDDWNLYCKFFKTTLERGSDEYNQLIADFWPQVIRIVESMSAYIQENNICLLYLVNSNSNPGNIALSLATVIVSEAMGIPVINNSHDFYWEGGNSEIDRKVKKLPKGPRDFFFTNSHIGEIFSIIDVLFPWESRNWFSLNINNKQIDHVIGVNGHNAGNVGLIGTAVDTIDFSNISNRKKLNTLKQFERIFSRNSKRLVAYSINGVIKNGLIDVTDPHPILIGNRTKVFNNFVDENIIFLQPTRIVSRKRIEVDFRLVKKLFNNRKFLNKFNESPNLKLTILVTGPIPPGQVEYFNSLLFEFRDLLASIPKKEAERIHLGFMFSAFDKRSFRREFDEPIGIPELFNVASLILLPSKTEGRGLPIIEAAASGVPIFCRRYYPENVYAEVIGEHLPEMDRLKVIEYNGKKITNSQIDRITERVFFAQKYTAEIMHNKKVVRKRYSLNSLKNNLEDVVYRLFLQIKSKEQNKDFGKYFKEYANYGSENYKYVEKLVDTENRVFMQGYGKLEFMLYLKSLIDPSYFRVEEQNIRGMAHSFSRELVQTGSLYDTIPTEMAHEFYNHVDGLFTYYEEEIGIQHDHSFAYRHRNKKHYPYQKYTFQELTGMINYFFKEIIKPNYHLDIDRSSHFFTNWDLAISQITSSNVILIDDRKVLKEKLQQNIPIAYFPGKYVKYELELIALQSFRYKLNIPVEEPFTHEMVEYAAASIEPIFIFVQESALARWMRKKDIEKYLTDGSDNDLKLLYQYGLIKIVQTEQLSIGINMAQLGEKALKTLIKIKDNGGIIITTRRNSTFMTDIIEIDKFHIGSIDHILAANIMGIPMGSGYIQFVPAGIRTTLAYPTPIQTSKDFSDALNSDLYMYLCDEFGEDKVMEFIKEDAKKFGNPISTILRRMKKHNDSEEIVEHNQITGIHSDGMPYSGAYAKLNLNNAKTVNFEIINSTTGTQTVTKFIKDFTEEFGKEVLMAWNGGYILNPELVGKLGLSENFIGAPLGLIISKGQLLSPPLFNKAALLIKEDGTIAIEEVSSSDGFSLHFEGNSYNFDSSVHNCDFSKDEEPDLCFYDLMYPEDAIYGNGRVLVRLSGSTVKDIIYTDVEEELTVFPVGLTLSFNKDIFPTDLKVEDKLDLKFPQFENVKHAVEAGPRLVRDGMLSIDMKLEGWKSTNSVKTQAARLDYTDMRGPKIAVGVDADNNLFVLTINGRIRESVGATHNDMAEILIKHGMVAAMGFDPGGSSTLVVDGTTLNISPYNKKYEENIFALSPQPRAVANAVLVYLDS